MAFLTPQRALIVLFAYTSGLSFALTYLTSQGLTETPAVRLGASLAFSVLIFVWYWADSQARSFPRTPWLNVAVVAVAFAAIPYYLFKSRPASERTQAFANLCGVVLLLFASMILGGLPVALLAQ